MRWRRGVERFLQVIGLFACLSSALFAAEWGMLESTSAWQPRLDLNDASYEQLIQLPGMTPQLAQQIVAWRQRYGEFDSLLALRQLDGVDDALLWDLADYLEVATPRVRYFWQTETLAGSGQGDAPAVSFRLRHQHVDWAMGSDWVSISRHQLSYRHDLEAWQSHGESQALRPSSLYFWQRQRQRGYILGHYRLAFAQGVTLANRSPSGVDGWFEPSAPQADLRAGRFRREEQFFGAAARFGCDDCSQSSSTLHLFFSAQPRDLYQYDLHYGPDAAREATLDRCESVGSQRGNFLCGSDGRWYANDIVDAQGASVQYAYIADAYHETLAGAAWHWRSEDGWYAGLVHYRARDQFLIQAPQLRFSPTAGYPETMAFGASGMSLGWHSLLWQFDSELARSSDGGLGWLSSLSWRGQNFHQGLQLHHYDPRFRNPYSRSAAARDEYLGLRQSNQQGARWSQVWQWRVLGWRSQIDYWRQLRGDGAVEETQGWQHDWLQRLTLSLPAAHELALQVTRQVQGDKRSVQLSQRQRYWHWRQQLDYQTYWRHYGWYGSGRFAVARWALEGSFYQPLGAQDEQRPAARALAFHFQQRWSHALKLLYVADGQERGYSVSWRIRREI